MCSIIQAGDTYAGTFCSSCTYEFCVFDAYSMPELAAESGDLYSISLGLEICKRKEHFAQELATLGFKDMAFERLTLGIVAIHTARKPAATESDSDHMA
jgi:ubiquinone/menaquinone biosynthesis C-methylase UbiE